MNLSHFIPTLLLLSSLAAFAQQQTEMTGPDLSGDMTAYSDSVAITPPPGAPVNANGDAQWYVNMDYAGFEFELPAGTVVDNGARFIAKYPDGTFGLSMTNEQKKGSNQKVAYEVCRRLAQEYRLTGARVEKVNFGKCAGAKASGMQEGMMVTVLVLPIGDGQVTTVLLATPNRHDWTNHFLSTLKR